MRVQDSAIARESVAVPAPPADRGGLALAGLGVAVFSLTFPTTSWALEGFGPWSVTSVRIALAALIAVGCLAAARVPPPARRHWPGLVTVAAGCVLGFPLLTTFALRTTTAAHAAVVVGLLPLTTACYAAARGGFRPRPAFWAAALVGAAVVVGFTLREGGGTLGAGDPYLFAALLLCAAGYGEGARLARDLPGWHVSAWSLVACLPLSLPGAALALLVEPAAPTWRAMAGVLWLAVAAQFLGLLAWYRGLARAGTARASQLQLAQPLLTLGWAALLLGERLTPLTAAAALAVLVCIAVTQRVARGPGAGTRRRLERA
ncbi:DMT family transporter [Streptomyces sp. B6B3]|uniref:DMT family transporter n=1 Tax=Streptomyces sp. B6B3 TaxID=3153570 RepID=UPI00325EACA0